MPSLRGAESSLKDPRQHLKGNTVRYRPESPQGQEEPTKGDRSATGLKPQSSSPPQPSNNAEKAGTGGVHHGSPPLKEQEITPKGNTHLLAIQPLQETRAIPAKRPQARVLPEFSLQALFILHVLSKNFHTE